MEGQITQLKQEVRELKAEVNKLRAELASVHRAVFGESDSEIGFSVVGSTADSAAAGYPPSSSTVEGQSWSEREAAAAKIGRFLRAAVNEGYRGDSGRKEILACSNFWIVVRDYSGTVYSPVKVFGRWAGAERLVKRGNQVGDSVFVGLPSKREINKALEAGRFEWDGTVE